MSNILTWVKDSPWVALIGFVSAVLSIIGFFNWKSKAKNKLNDVDIDGSYTGGSRKAQGKKTIPSNELTKTKIKGDYTGGDDNR